MLRDVLYSLRMLRKNPGFAAVAVLTRAFGIGANTAMFSVVKAVLLEPLPYAHAERLMVAPMSLPDFEDLRESVTAFQETALWASNGWNLSGGNGEPEEMLGAIVTARFFPMLGVTPVVGRTFDQEDYRKPVAVIGYGMWKQRFGGDPAIIGRTLRLSDWPYTIVGVMPASFQIPSPEFQVWTPLEQALGPGENSRTLRVFRNIARVREGVTRERAQAEVDMVAGRLQRAYPDTNAGVGFAYAPLPELLLGSVRPALLLLLGAVGLLLLIACANLTNLLLARTMAREREMAVRVSLGANRSRIARQLLTESLLLALLGGASGLLLATWGIGALPAFLASRLPRGEAIRLDSLVLSFSVGVTGLTSIVFGLGPAILGSPATLGRSLREGAHGAGAGPRARRVLSGLVVAELALALALLLGAGLLVRSLSRLQVETGFDADRLLTLSVVMAGYDEGGHRAQVVEAVLERIRALPGIEVAGAGTAMPPVTAQRSVRYEVEGEGPGVPVRTAYFIATDPLYFRTLGTPLLDGRAFDERDAEGAPGVAILNRSLARRLFRGERAVGRRVRLRDATQSAEWRTIVGVVGDVRYQGLDDPGQAALYTPFAQTPSLWTAVFVRTTSEPMAVVRSVKAAVATAGAGLTAMRPRPMTELVAESIARPRFNALLLSCFAILALVVATVGIYGLIAYSVAQRTHEIGVRIALGAARRDVLGLVVGQGLRLTAVGIALGVVGALALTRLMQSLLFEVSPQDPLTFVAGAAFLLVVGLLASYLPARRAARVDPAVALRAE